MIGELLVCPYCLDVWTATGFLGGLVVAPRATRWVASVFAVVAIEEAGAYSPVFTAYQNVLFLDVVEHVEH